MTDNTYNGWSKAEMDAAKDEFEKAIEDLDEDFFRRCEAKIDEKLKKLGKLKRNCKEKVNERNSNGSNTPY